MKRKGTHLKLRKYRDSGEKQRVLKESADTQSCCGNMGMILKDQHQSKEAKVFLRVGQCQYMFWTTE